MILINDFKAEPREMRDAMLAAVARVLDSGWYILGDEVSAFEREWAACQCQCKSIFLKVLRHIAAVLL